MYFATLLSAASFVAVIMAQNMVHVDCNPDPDSQCNVDKYCTYTSNNNQCQSQWTDDAVPSFQECLNEDICGDNHVCHDGQCCNLSALPNGEADCPSRDEIQACCFQRSPGPGGLGLFQPPQSTRPTDLDCGC